MRLECKIEYAITNFNLELDMLKEGEIFGISGPSGCGKSTLLDIICGLRKPQQGKIVLDNRVLYDSSQRINIPARKRGMGYVFQQGNLFPHQSVRGNLRMGTRISARKGKKVNLPEICEILEIDHLLKRSAMTLSGGERQRVALGRALAASPELLLLDEPFSALDASRKERLIRYLLSINKIYKIPILLVSHDKAELDEMSDVLLYLREGRLLTLADDLGKDRNGEAE